MSERTIVVKVEVDEATDRVLTAYSISCARWMKAAFGRLYSDKRHNHGALYEGVLKKGKAGNQAPNIKGPLYAKLVRRDCPDRIPSDIAHAKDKQALATKVAIIWGNFQGPRSRHRKLPRPKGRLPRFHPLARFGSQEARLEPDGQTISLPYPLMGRAPGTPHRIAVKLAESVSAGKQGEQHRERLALVRKRLKRTQRSGALTSPSLEFHRGEQDGAWYVHVPVESEDRQVSPAASPTTLGMDLGERSIAATATVVGKHGEAIGNRRVFSGLSTRHALHAITRRRAKLQWRARKGKVTRYAKVALVRMRGKQTRIDTTLAHQVSRAVVDGAVDSGALTLAYEDLRRTRFRGFHRARTVAGRKVRHGKRMRTLNRWTQNEWSRGKVRDFMLYKAEAAGIRSVEVAHAGTSTLCPVCNPSGWGAGRARNRKGNTSRTFRCSKCGWVAHDDANAAINIARRALNPEPGKGRASRQHHYPTPASGMMGVGSTGSSPGGGDSCQPQKPREEGVAVATGDRGDALDPTEKPTTTAVETGAQAHGATASSGGREVLSVGGIPRPQAVATNARTRPGGDDTNPPEGKAAPCERSGGDPPSGSRSNGGSPSEERRTDPSTGDTDSPQGVGCSKTGHPTPR